LRAQSVAITAKGDILDQARALGRLEGMSHRLSYASNVADLAGEVGADSDYLLKTFLRIDTPPSKLRDARDSINSALIPMRKNLAN